MLPQCPQGTDSDRRNNSRKVGDDSLAHFSVRLGSPPTPSGREAWGKLRRKFLQHSPYPCVLGLRTLFPWGSLKQTPHSSAGPRIYFFQLMSKPWQLPAVSLGPELCQQPQLPLDMPQPLYHQRHRIKEHIIGLCRSTGRLPVSAPPSSLCLQGSLWRR